MNDIPWATPGAVGRLTIPQLYCLAGERPPGSRRARSFEERQAFFEAEARAATEWSR